MADLPALRENRDLTEHQREFLLELAAGKTRKEAAKAINISFRTVQGWQSQPAFRQAISELFEGSIVETRNRLAGATATAMDGLLEAMEATKDATLHLDCPNCGESLEVTAKIPNWTARNKAHELVLRAAKVLKDVKEVEGSIVTMNIEQKIALALYKAEKWDQIPSYMWGQLQKLGLIPADQPQPYNAQFEVMDEDNQPIR